MNQSAKGNNQGKKRPISCGLWITHPQDVENSVDNVENMSHHVENMPLYVENSSQRPHDQEAIVPLGGIDMNMEVKVQEPKKPVWKVFLLVVALVLGVNAAVVVTNQLPGGYGGLSGLLLIFLLAFYSSRLMNRKLATYTYRFDGQELQVERRLGRKDKPLIEIPIAQVEWVRPLEEVKPQLPRMKRARKTMYYACQVKGDDVYLLQFHEGSRRYRLLFQPGDQMAKALTKAMKKK